MRAHFTICAKRLAASDLVERRGRNSKAGIGSPAVPPNPLAEVNGEERVQGDPCGPGGPPYEGRDGLRMIAGDSAQT